MNIVKQLEDPEFMDKLYPNHQDNEKWFWGLGDDGHLYFKCNRWDTEHPEKWKPLTDTMIATYAHFTLRVMKRIVKAFGHLVIYT